MRKWLCLLLLAGTGCLRLNSSPFDSSQGGWLGALITALLSPTRTIVAVGAGGKAYTSTDGFAWTERTITTNTLLDFYSVTHNGSIYAAVGGNTGNTQAVIFTSADGITWTQSLSVTGASTTRFYDVAAASGTIVAVGSAAGSTSLIRTSTNGGTTWSTGGGTTGVQGRITHDGTYFMSAQAQPGAAVLTYRSTDGLTFAQTTNPPFTSTGKPAATGDLLAVGSRTIFAGTDDSGTNPPNRSAATSNQGSTAWTGDTAGSRIFGAAATTAFSPIARALAYNGSRLVAVGDACRVDFTSNLTSLTWNTSALTMTGCSGTDWQGMIHDGSKFIAVGSGGKVAVSGSGASTDWTITTVGSTNINGIAIR